MEVYGSLRTFFGPTLAMLRLVDSVREKNRANPVIMTVKLYTTLLQQWYNTITIAFREIVYPFDRIR